MTEHSLAIRESAALPSPDTYQTMLSMAGVFIKSGLLPTSIKSPEAALTIMLKARELGIAPLYGLSNIVLVQGKPTCSAELMLALIYRDHGDSALIVEDSSSEAARASYRRRAWDAARSYTFTIDDARTAGLLSNPTWTKYPAAMLRARVISAIARMAFPDSIAGMYLPEELGAAVRVTDDGEVEVVQPTITPASPALPAPTPIRAAPDRPLPEDDGDLDWKSLATARDPALMAGAVTGAVPLEAPTVADQLTGADLVAACEALASRLRDAGIVPGPFPALKVVRTIPEWRAWYATSLATLQQRIATAAEQAPLLNVAPPTAYDEAPRGRGGRGR